MNKLILITLFLYSFMTNSAQCNNKIEKWHPKEDYQCNLYYYDTYKSPSPNPAVLICPGGGYSHLATDHEGVMVAKWLNSIGIKAFILEYSVNDENKKEGIHPRPLDQALTAMSYIRKNYEEFNIIKNKIGIMGFSAGGHLASSVLVHYSDRNTDFKTSSRPDFGILGYPVISFADSLTHKGSRFNLIGENPSEEMINYYSNELHIKEDTPNSFLFHSADDNAVPVENSIIFHKRLIKNNIKSSLHIFSEGGHGYGIIEKNYEVSQWKTLLKSWLYTQGILQKK